MSILGDRLGAGIFKRTSHLPDNVELFDVVGFIPQLLSIHNSQDAKIQLHEGYAHGGGWTEFRGFQMNPETFVLTYPGDPPMPPLAIGKLRNETICVYESAWGRYRAAGWFVQRCEDGLMAKLSWQDKAVRKLQLRATEATKWRGHDMEPWDRYAACNASRKCKTCPGEVHVDINPPANSIDIAGTAVALNCPIKDDGTD